jgi:hypothetical protein
LTASALLLVLQATRPWKVMGRKRIFASGVADVGWSSDSAMVVCCGDGAESSQQVAFVFSVEDGSTVAELPGEPGVRFVRASFSIGSELVAVARDNGSVSILDPRRRALTFLI